MKKFGGSENWKSKIETADQDYKFQQELTSKLDLHTGDFTEVTILEIVLWKTNRYPEISKSLIEDINRLRSSYSLDKAKALLRRLLLSKGFDLPMASTVLRFACPDQLQIIDQRVYRFITPDNDSLKIPFNIEEKIALYFRYILSLKTLCAEHDIPFHKSDRILYQLDKSENKGIPITTYTKLKASNP